MDFNHPLNGARTLAEPFAPSAPDARTVRLVAGGAIHVFAARSRGRGEFRTWRLYAINPGSRWEDGAFIVLQFCGVAGVLLALGTVLFL